MATSGLSDSLKTTVLKVDLHQHSFTWTILNFIKTQYVSVSLSSFICIDGKPSISGKPWKISDVFKPGELQYGLRLGLYPNFTENYKDYYVTLALMWDRTNTNLYSIKNMISIIDSLGNIVHSTTMSDLCFRNLISRKSLLDKFDNLLPNNTLKVRCDIEIVYKDVETQSVNCFNNVNASNISKDIISLLESEIGSDVKIICDDTELRAHKAILSARSPVFQNMFSHNMLENQKNVVNIDDVKAPVMKELLHYIYGKEMGNLLSDNIYFELFAAADKYGLLDLKQHCASIMVKHLNADTVLKVAFLARLHDSSELFRSASVFVKRNALQLMVSKNWVDFLKSCPEIAQELVSA